ncbi:putative cytochrome P450 hydroxylase [Pseudonocardia sp. Ae168_Ps1]|jgi:cytochrome P450|uniref:cytochrome P450 n=1 Tax=unclassified Pseudonocardia TaxID=2619320 RepID=UPI0001FFEBDB|nr:MULTISPECIES: cytochrome P450 [unclassified Pseudonocardia]ALE72744.1 cytochrome P450 [Pseudonocardia sp. EC080625-04]ALL76062.1 cytochrome P450 [Pseudonocardia sp. EC080610-09]ALL83089.1 cytochrome P450 [Pseudonocardia sp. EC080619-01]OLL73213.1 putative cytochrome P450 hydroxylase [Pseudonocardia sp. Ae150A_Ps1]OLL79190.1 putative cytochrome P450 hydroxylase [Pseudonocardia sp. Ae168_Ps1]
MTLAAERPQLPFARPNILDLAPFYEVLRREAPVAPVTTPAGDPAWLVTRFSEVRDLLGDKRFGRSHPEPEKASRISTAAVQDGPTGDYASEADEHARMRRLLTPAFSAKRMRRLSGHVQELVDGYVDALLADHDTAADGVVDLHAHLAFPLPVAVICTLLGVPESDGEYFRALSDRMATFSGQDAHDARTEFGRYMAGLAEGKRAAPAEDVISDLVQAQADDETFGYPEMVRLCVGLLFAGHETTVNRIGLGLLFLMNNRDQWDALVADPDGRIDAVIEEIMRLGAPGDLGLLRYAHTDVEIGGVTIERGDALILSINAANRDTGVFADAETFDPDRGERGHIGFGHGPHFCIGASLARTELRAVFVTLARRVPELRLAIGMDELDIRTDHLTGGVRSLPVQW